MLTPKSTTDGPGFVTSFPQRIADREDNLEGPIVVGAVDNDGNKAPFSQELRYGRMLWAPGVDIGCADGSREIARYVMTGGTSYGKSYDQLRDMAC